ncbi:MAG: transcription antitermination factor NusB [Rhodocyclaceae bacterium]|nr:transcription antitermination factor NusB [Rhodocyclaceae bacterium]
MNGDATPGDRKPGSRPGPSPRRRAREFIVQGLYQHLVGGQDEAAIRAQAEEVEGFEKADRRLYGALLREVLDRQAALQDLLAPHVDRPWNEVSPVERGILLLGACELGHHPETPFRVIINEAIELAKTYGGADGHKFVNGVLDKLAPQLRPDEAKRP